MHSRASLKQKTKQMIRTSTVSLRSLTAWATSTYSWKVVTRWATYAWEQKSPRVPCTSSVNSSFCTQALHPTLALLLWPFSRPYSSSPILQVGTIGMWLECPQPLESSCGMRCESSRRCVPRGLVQTRMPVHEIWVKSG